MAPAEIEELWRRIRIILSQERTGNFYRPLNANPWGDEILPPDEIHIARVGAFELIHEQVLLLRRLYTSIAPDLQQNSMPGALVNQLGTARARVVTHALLDIRAIDYVLRAEPELKIRGEMSHAVVEKLQHEAGHFSDSELDALETFADINHRHGLEMANATIDAPPLGRLPHEEAHIGQRLLKLATQAKKAIGKIRYLRLREELLQTGNAQINEDQITLSSRLDKLGLGTDRQQTLHQIDRKARLATVPAEGAHALGSGPEQVRVTKNTILEWTLMLAGRLDTFRTMPKTANPA